MNRADGHKLLKQRTRLPNEPNQTHSRDNSFRALHLLLFKQCNYKKFWEERMELFCLPSNASVNLV